VSLRTLKRETAANFAVSGGVGSMWTCERWSLRPLLILLCLVV
jgi:hypothetical protein